MVGVGFLAMAAGALAAGFATMPFITIVIGKALPKGVRTTMGGWLFTVAQLGLDGGVLTRTRKGAYVMQRRAYMGPDSRWSRLGKAAFGVTYQKAEEVFGHDLITPGADDQRVGGAIADGGYRVLNGARAGFNAYVPTQKDGVYYVATSALERLQGAGGIGEAMQAQEHAMKEHGGDTDTSTKMMVLGMIIMLVCGLGSGYMVFL